eukprot:4573859-Ditylum_brightwellii.AAC.1
MQTPHSRLTRTNFWTFLSFESQQVGVGSLQYKALIQLTKAYASLWSSVLAWSLANQARTSPRLKNWEN